jgi:hypothetical protein
VIRADFDYRASVLRQFPETFSVPARYSRHMMIVADLARGDRGAIEDALEAAWQVQRSADWAFLRCRCYTAVAFTVAAQRAGSLTSVLPWERGEVGLEPAGPRRDARQRQG